MESAKNLMQKTNYLNKEISYLKNVDIVEYDIKSAGFTTIKYRKLLPSDIIEKLEGMSNDRRNVYVGKQIKKYPKIGEELITTLEEVRQDFAVINGILEEEVLAIKRDAVFLIRKKPDQLNIREIFEFRPKEKYTSYVYLNGKEFYYSAFTDELTIKGLGEEEKELQKDYLLKDIKDIMKMSEKFMPDQMFLYLKKYRSRYLNRELDKDTYRHLDDGVFVTEGYKMAILPDNLLPDIDITHNYIAYILPLFRLIV